MSDRNALFAAGDGAPPDATEAVTLPVVEEVLTVDKRVIETGRVRIQTLIEEQQETIREQVRRGIVGVDRVAVGQFVDATPQVREEGDVLIVPVLEERLVVEKRLFLVEELHLTRRTETVPVELAETRRVMRAVVDRDEHQQQEAN